MRCVIDLLEHFPILSSSGSRLAAAGITFVPIPVLAGMTFSSIPALAGIGVLNPGIRRD
jgi:hypothetical protein